MGCVNINFNEFNDLIKSGAKEIILDSNIKVIDDNKAYNKKLIKIFDDEIVLDGNGNLIDGDNFFGLFEISGTNIILKNFIFKNAQGGVIFNKTGNLSIENCIFLENKANTFKYRTSHHDVIQIIPHDLEKGGAIYNESGVINIENCIFEKNDAAKIGGAVYNDNGTINIKNSKFIDNIAKIMIEDIYNQNGVVIIDNCEFKGKNTEIILNNGVMNINNSHFEKHHKIININDLNTQCNVLVVNQKNYKYLDNLIHSNKKDVTLDSNIYIGGGIFHDSKVENSDKTPENEYLEGINVDIDNLCLDGLNHTINGRFTSKVFKISSNNIIFKNLIFEEAMIEIAKNTRVTFENCKFKSKQRLVILNNSNLVLKDCEFEEHNTIVNDGSIQSNNDITNHIVKVENSLFECNDLKNYTLYLDSHVLINGGDDCEIDVDELIIDGNSFFIRNDSLKHINVKNLVLKNLTLHNKSLLTLFVEGNLKIINCIIEDTNFINYSGTLTIEDSTLIDGRSITNNCGEVHIKNTKFEAFGSKSIFLENNGGNIVIVKSFFNNFSVHSSSLILNNSGMLTLKECNFEDNFGQSDGGIIKIDDGEVSLYDCFFKGTRNGHQNYGGAISNNGLLTAVGCKFIENKSGKYGGAVANFNKLELFECEFINNHCDIEASAIYNNGLLDIYDCKFIGDEEYIIVNDNEIKIKESQIQKHHKILTSNSMGIEDIDQDKIFITQDKYELDNLIHSGKKEIMLDCYYCANSLCLDVDDLIIDGNGNTIDARLNDSIFEIKADNITLKNIVFKNVGRSNSVIYNDNKNILIENCVFENNTSFRDGAVIFNKSGLITIKNSLFKDNTANYDVNGGAIYNVFGNIILENCEFSNNKSGRYGGALYNEKGNVDLINCKFNNNFCKYLGETYMIWYGGAIYNELGNININKCIFKDNWASGPGDAIFNLANISIKNSIFQAEGDDIIANYGFAEIESCKFDDDVIITNMGIIFSNDDEINDFTENNGKIHSKSFFNYSNHGFKYLDEVINSNITEIFLEHDITLQENEKGIYYEGIEIKNDNMIIDAKNHYIDCNMHSRIFRVTGKTIVFKNFIFKNANSIDGAIKSMDASIIFENCYFDNNMAHIEGIIDSYSSSLKFINCHFENNYVITGSLINSKNSSFYFENCIFLNNSSRLSIISGVQSNLIFIDCQFRNQSNVCLRCNQSKLVLKKTIFQNNKSVMLFWDVSLNMEECKFLDNQNNTCLIDGSNIISSIKNCLFENNGFIPILMNFNKSRIIFDECTFKDNQCEFLIHTPHSRTIFFRCIFRDLETMVKDSHPIFINNNGNIGDKQFISDLNDFKRDFDKLICDADKNILLDSNYSFIDAKIDSDDLHVDGLNHTLAGILIISAKNVILKNVKFENQIIIDDNCSACFENCIFEDKSQDVIINGGNLTLKDCNFNEHQDIDNNGEIIVIVDGKTEIIDDSALISFSKEGEVKIQSPLSRLFG